MIFLTLRKMRVVATLTTLPGRYERLERCLQSLNKQTYKLDAIYLGLPARAHRLEIDYPPLPEEIRELCSIVPCEDYGPITKILGAIIREDDPNTIIISFDDDNYYPPSLVEDLVKQHLRHPYEALCTTGASMGKGLMSYLMPFHSIHINCEQSANWISSFNIPSNGRLIDIVYGCGGILYLRGFFPRVEELDEQIFQYIIHKDLFLNDDILISGYLSNKGIKRRIVPVRERCEPFARELSGDEISAITAGCGPSYKRAIKKIKELGLMTETVEPPPYYESVWWRVLIIILLFIAIVVLIVVLRRIGFPSSIY